MNKIIITIAIVVLGLSAYAQNNESDTVLLFSKFTDQGVMLKIAPQKAQTWLMGAENGYQIWRKEVGVDKSFKLITSTPLKPYAKDDYANIENGDSVRALQQQAIFDNIAKNKQPMSMVERIKFVEKLQNEYGFYFLVSSRIRALSQSSGLEYIDNTVQQNRFYIYKVNIFNDKSKTRTTMVTVNTLPSTLLRADLAAVEGDKTIKLLWEHKKEQNPVLCYHIERSTDGKNFERITAEPLYHNHNLNSKQDDEAEFNNVMFFVDQLDANYKPYYYRIVGIDIWAMEHTSQEVIMAMGRDKTPPPVVQNIKYEINDSSKSITYKWDYTAPSDFKGFKFYVAHKLKGQYKEVEEPISAADIRAYKFENVTEGNAYYFRIAAIDTAGNIAYSMPRFANLPDIYPPSAPTGFSASIDTIGALRLKWNKNPESDIRGYKIVASNSKSAKMIAPQSMLIVDTFYMDTLNIKSLSKYKYFAIRAVDHNFNMSERSPIISVQLPDIIPPSAGKISAVELEESQARILWIPSASKDVASQNILRRKMGEEQWAIVKVVGATTRQYTDIIDQPGVYEYSIEAVDSANNKGEHALGYAIELKAKKQNIVITEFKAKKKDGAAVLSWTATGGEPKYYIVYRKDKYGIKSIASVNQPTFTDKSVKPDSGYQYYIVPQDDKGKLYSRSKTKTLNF